MRGLVALLAIIGIAGWSVDTAQATGLQMQPLSYRTSLQVGEKKTGYVDISNPTGERVRLKSSVQAFRQIDDRGGLEFYDNQEVSTGITPDLDEFELGPREAVRMYFLIDGSKLPAGDIFAALLVSTAPGAPGGGTAMSVRLGTLLVIENGTPGPRQAVIESLDVSPLQTGSAISGRYQIRNTASPDPVSGFFPVVTVSLSPLGAAQQHESPLVLSGASRQAEFDLPGSRLGVYRLTVRYGDSEQSQWVGVATGYWRWLLPVVVGFAIASPLLWRALRRRSRGYFRAR